MADEAYYMETTGHLADQNVNMSFVTVMGPESYDTEGLTVEISGVENVAQAMIPPLVANDGSIVIAEYTKVFSSEDTGEPIFKPIFVLPYPEKVYPKKTNKINLKFKKMTVDTSTGATSFEYLESGSTILEGVPVVIMVMDTHTAVKNKSSPEPEPEPETAE